MNWEEIGAIGQVLGSLAVFVTLVYLSIQTRHAQRTFQRSINQSRAEGASQLFMHMFNNERFSNALSTMDKNWPRPPAPIITTIVQRGGVSESDARMIHYWYMAWWHFRTQTILEIDELTEGARISFDAACRANYAPDTLLGVWYESQKGLLDPDAVRYIDNLLARPG